MTTFASSAVRAFLLYALVYLPLSGLVGILEGAAYGHWGLSSDDWIYQLGAFAVLLPWLILAGLLAAPLLCLLLRSLRPRSRSTLRVWQAVSGPAAVLSAAALTSGVAGSPWSAPLALVQLPVAFVGGSVLLALLCARFAVRSDGSPTPLAA